MDARDGLVKNIYSKMFDWIVSMINTNIRPIEPHAMFIGVLDIFGFEVSHVCTAVLLRFHPSDKVVVFLCPKCA